MLSRDMDGGRRRQPGGTAQPMPEKSPSPNNQAGGGVSHQETWRLLEFPRPQNSEHRKPGDILWVPLSEKEALRAEQVETENGDHFVSWGRGGESLAGCHCCALMEYGAVGLGLRSDAFSLVYKPTAGNGFSS